MPAETARPGTGHPTAATVLAFPKKAADRSRRPPRRERTAAPMPPRPGPDLTPQQKLAASLEARFAQYGRTLTDEDTAEGMLITLDAVRAMLQGAHAQGLLTDDAYRDLDAMIAGMANAPGLLG